MSLSLPDRTIDMKIAMEFLEWSWVTNLPVYSVCPSKICVENPSGYIAGGQKLTSKPSEVYPYHFVGLPKFTESLRACEKIIAKFTQTHKFELQVSQNHSTAFVWNQHEYCGDLIFQGYGKTPSEAITKLCLDFIEKTK